MRKSSPRSYFVTHNITVIGVCMCEKHTPRKRLVAKGTENVIEDWARQWPGPWRCPPTTRDGYRAMRRGRLSRSWADADKNWFAGTPEIINGPLKVNAVQPKLVGVALSPKLLCRTHEEAHSARTTDWLSEWRKERTSVSLAKEAFRTHARRTQTKKATREIMHIFQLKCTDIHIKRNE